ncbi:MAG TPA: hypothetical protein VE152_00840, partial [Acidimicrobiales bacterium]|nr:hypothetical protein [Acidimicrobiales bacterium]
MTADPDPSPRTGVRGVEDTPNGSRDAPRRRSRGGVHVARPRHGPGRRLLEWVVILAVAAGCAFGIKDFVIQAFYIPSGSMIPTLGIG